MTTRRGPPEGEGRRNVLREAEERLPRIKRRRQKWVKAGGERGGGVGRERGRCKSWRFGERTSVGGVGKARAQWKKSRAAFEVLSETEGLSGGRRAARTRAEETRR